MTDSEYDILDELYFVKTLEQLSKELNIDVTILVEEIHNLIKKGWVRVIDKNDQEILLTSHATFLNDQNYRFIATKQGLKAHNQV